MSLIWHITSLTVSLALLATAIVLPPAVLLAWVLARREFPGKTIVETVVSLPLVMPPVATGVLLLYLVGRRSVVGRLLAEAGIEILFTWKAVVMAMAVMSLPLVVRTARAGFEQVSTRYEDIAATLGAGPARIFLTISLPLALPGVLAGAVLGFSRAVGEFGATVMVAGALPGSTRTLAVAIYTVTETGQDRAAALLLGVSVVIAFVALWASNRIGRRAA
jgi:molybdate transport system permease protein